MKRTSVTLPTLPTRSRIGLFHNIILKCYSFLSAGIYVHLVQLCSQKVIVTKRDYARVRGPYIGNHLYVFSSNWKFVCDLPEMHEFVKRVTMSTALEIVTTSN